MSLESATYISDLNSSFPPDADPVGQADDHLRLIKSTIKATFPNITGPVTATQGQLASSGGSLVPIGTICWWYGTTANIPSGYAYCDGRTVARSDGGGNITTPNLIGRFIIADSGTGTTGGTSTHSHNLTIAGHGLTASEMAAHTHGVSDPGHGHGVTDPGHRHWMDTTGAAYASSAFLQAPTSRNVSGTSIYATSPEVTGISVNGAFTGISIQSAGSGTAHGHPGSTSDTANHLPPYYALCPIMKV